MSTWSRVALGDIVEITSGGTPRKSEQQYWGGEIPWISGASMHALKAETSDRMVTDFAIGNGTRLAPAGSSLILVRGMSLLDEIRVSHVVRPVAFNQDVKAMAPIGDLDPWFLTYLLLAHRGSLLNAVHQAGHGTGVLATERLTALEVSLPPLDEQRRIAEVLGALDDLIGTNDRLIELQQSSVDVALAREISHGVGGMSPLFQIADFENKKRVPLSSAERALIPGPFPYYGANGQIDSVGEFLFDEPRLLVGEDGTVMNESGQAVTRLVWGKYWVNNHAHVLRGAGGISTAMLRALIRNLNVRDRVTGAVQPKLSMSNLKAAKVFVPRSTPFASAVDALTEAEMALSDENEQLRRTRDEILPLLMSGAVRVRSEGVAA